MIIKTEPAESVIPAHFRSPQPRRRRGRVEVLLPTKKQLYGDNPPVFENALSFIEKNILKYVIKKEEEKSTFLLPYGKAEVKKEEMLSEDVVNRRIALIESYDVDLDPAIRDVTTTRIFTSKQWGGNTQSTFPAIRPELLARHGLDDFMFLNLFFNPHAPQWPGAPGLFFASSVNPKASEWPEIERVLVRLKANCWLYVGQYQCTPAPSLSPEEWKSQAPKVKQTWTNKVSTQGWGIDIRAKIVLQKRLGRNLPPKSSKMREIQTRNSMRLRKRFTAHLMKVMQRLQIIQSWCMKCVGYDEDFQRVIVAGNAEN